MFKPRLKPVLYSYRAHNESMIYFVLSVIFCVLRHCFGPHKFSYIRTHLQRTATFAPKTQNALNFEIIVEAVKSVDEQGEEVYHPQFGQFNFFFFVIVGDFIKGNCNKTLCFLSYLNQLNIMSKNIIKCIKMSYIISRYQYVTKLLSSPFPPPA